MDRSSATPVLVVGAGPAGLVAAITLARHGVPCRVVDRRPGVWAMPRATVVSTRAMELVRRWGIADAILMGAVDVEMRLLRCPSLATADMGDAFTVGYPTPAEAALLSPCAPACVAQDHVELVLQEHLAALGVTVEREVAVVAVEQRADSVIVTTRDLTSGAERTVEARYVVAADGAHGTLRESIGIAARGPDNLYEGVSAVFHAPLWDVAGDHRFLLYGTFVEGGEGTLLPAGPPDRWLYAFGWPPGEAPDRPPTERQIVERIRRAAGVDDLPVRIDRVGSLVFAAKLADTFRRERVFLVGDAAHRVSPRGGTGMNTAIQGGFDLGWKLAWVLAGWASDALLDTYEAERRPIATHNYMRSIDDDGSVRPVVDEVLVDLGGRMPHAWVPVDGTTVSTLDLVGPGLTLFTGPDAARWRAAVDACRPRIPIDVRRLPVVAARSIGIRGHGALLVRADGAPVASWTAGVDSRLQLDGALRAALLARDRTTPSALEVVG